MRYAATYAFNVRRYIKRDIEADSDEEATRIAKEQAWPDIDAECAIFECGPEGYGSTAELDPYLMLDRLADDGGIDEEVAAETLEEPTP